MLDLKCTWEFSYPIADLFRFCRIFGTHYIEREKVPLKNRRLFGCHRHLRTQKLFYSESEWSPFEKFLRIRIEEHFTKKNDCRVPSVIIRMSIYDKEKKGSVFAWALSTIEYNTRYIYEYMYTYIIYIINTYAKVCAVKCIEATSTMKNYSDSHWKRVRNKKSVHVISAASINFLVWLFSIERTRPNNFAAQTKFPNTIRCRNNRGPYLPCAAFIFVCNVIK